MKISVIAVSLILGVAGLIVAGVIVSSASSNSDPQVTPATQGGSKDSVNPMPQSPKPSTQTLYRVRTAHPEDAGFEALMKITAPFEGVDPTGSQAKGD